MNRSGGEMLSVSDKSDSINKCTQQFIDKIELNILGVWQKCPWMY